MMYGVELELFWSYSVAPLGLGVFVICLPGAYAARLYTSAPLGLYNVRSYFITAEGGCATQ